MQEQGRGRSRLNDGSRRNIPVHGSERSLSCDAAHGRMEAGVVAVCEDPFAIDRAVSRISGRRMTFVRLVSGLPVLLLTTTGARTGAKRTQPLLYLRDGDDLVVIGSNWGQACA
jgi:F420H(2)-dependent quinone reductase